MSEKEKRQNLITKVNLMIRRANGMCGGTIRNKLIYEIDALLSFMYYAEYIKLNEYQELWKKICLNSDMARNKRKREVFNELYNNNDKLLEVYKNVLEQYKVNKIKYYDTTVNPNIMDKEVLEFFKHVDCDHLFNEIKQNEMFKRGSHHVDEGVCIDNMGLSYIVIGCFNKEKIEYYINLVHEMGHAYANRILQENKFGYYDLEIYREFISLTFVRMFLEFLKDRKVLSNDKINGICHNNEMIGYYNLYLGVRLCQIAQKDNKINPSEYSKYNKIIGDNNVTPCIHHYALGNLASMKLMNDYLQDKEEFILDFPYMIRKMSRMSLEEIIDEFTKVIVVYDKNKVYQKGKSRK